MKDAYRDTTFIIFPKIHYPEQASPHRQNTSSPVFVAAGFGDVYPVITTKPNQPQPPSKSQHPINTRTAADLSHALIVVIISSAAADVVRRPGLWPRVYGVEVLRLQSPSSSSLLLPHLFHHGGCRRSQGTPLLQQRGHQGQDPQRRGEGRRERLHTENGEGEDGEGEEED